MKIHLNNNCKSGICENGEKPILPLSRLAILSRLSIMCAAWMCVASATTVHAQADSDGLQQAGGFSSAATEVQNGVLQHGDQTYRVVDTASYRTAADAETTESSDIQQVGHHGQGTGNCSSCGTSSCGGSCGSISMPSASCGTCGTVCGGSNGHCGLGLGSICNSNRVSGLSCRGAMANDPCAPCQPYRYASVEALYMQRDDQNVNLNGTLPLSDFDYEFGPRIVVGAVYDCVNGYESSLVGPIRWNASNQRLADLTLAPAFTTPAPTLAVPNPTQINQIDRTYSNQRQSLTSEYISVDASKTINGWEIAKLLVGGRYVDFSEDYRYSGTTTTRNRTFPTGSAPATRDVTTENEITGLANDIDNRLIGLQVGLDLLYPISRFAYSDVRMRAGAYGNFAEVNYAQAGTSTPTVDVGTPLVTDIPMSLNSNASDDDVSLAGLFEFGTGIRYQVGEILSVRAGLELWYLSGVATTDRNIARQGRSIDTDDDVLFTGFSFGSELRW